MSIVKNKVIEDLSASGGDTCVVCFKTFEIYSIGECDHPVCYECSTRMRVLCQQNECPICRQSLSKVIFTNERENYRDLETKGRTEYYNKKYKIAFANIIIQKAFYSLLDHRCSMCNCRPLHSFEALKEHVRKEHEQFFCDICTDNLKIFSFERKSYNRQDLGMHRRKGDPDNKSHRGHPLCQYCDCRFLDRDDLFRHLRREHYFCHFCDADGSNQFYADYDSLRAHFRNDHFLCEEGDCAREQFTAVFRSEIDLKAHFANTHGKTLGKLQAKQARTLQLQITVTNQLGHNSRSRQEHAHADHRYENDYNRTKVNQQRNNPTIDAQNEQEFPSLDGGASSRSTVTLIHPSMSFHKSGPSGLARTKENFPALGGKAESLDDTGAKVTNNKNNQMPASAVIKKNKLIQQKPQDSMVIHVTRRPNNIANEPIPNKKDFPALPRKSNKQQTSLFEDLIPSTSTACNMNVVAAKHRLMVNDYVSEGNQSSNQKLQLVQNTNDKNKKDFPALPRKSYKQQTSLYEDLIPSTSTISNMNVVAAKHRLLVNDYVSDPTSSSNQKLQFVQNINEKNKEDFPDLPRKLNKQQASSLEGDLIPSKPSITNKNVIAAKHRSLGSDYVSEADNSSNLKLQLVQKINEKNKKDFPTLHKKLNKQKTNLLEEDLIPSTLSISNINAVAAKHRLLVNDYVSDPNSSSNQKLQLVQNTNDKEKRVQGKIYSLAKNDFPALESAATSNSQLKQNFVGVENSKLKNGNAPIVANYEKKNDKYSVLLKKSTNNDLNDKKNNKKSNNKTNTTKSTENKLETNKIKANENNNECNAINNNGSNKPYLHNENLENIFVNEIAQSPRPDFAKSKILKPPPGFQAVTVNSLANKSNNLTFTTSLGEIYRVLPGPNMYLPPPDSTKRNHDLILHFCNILPSSEDFEEFRCISKKFREGNIETFEYVEYCQAVLKDNYDEIFPELMALLPDISKQQELYLLYSQHIKKKSIQKTEHKLEICSECKQILKHADVEAHKKSHDLNLNFPSLSK